MVLDYQIFHAIHGGKDFNILEQQLFDKKCKNKECICKVESRRIDSEPTFPVDLITDNIH